MVAATVGVVATMNSGVVADGTVVGLGVSTEGVLVVADTLLVVIVATSGWLVRAGVCWTASSVVTMGAGASVEVGWAERCSHKVPATRPAMATMAHPPQEAQRLILRPRLYFTRRASAAICCHSDSSTGTVYSDKAFFISFIICLFLFLNRP